jgi:hypothetical protein
MSAEGGHSRSVKGEDARPVGGKINGEEKVTIDFYWKIVYIIGII